MRIDYITVAAQIVNFLILIWLLRRFLYGPVMRAMKRREERIARSLAEAQQKKEDAEKQQEEYQGRNRDFDRQREHMMEAARKEAEEERARLHRALESEIEERQKKWLRQIEAQHAEFLDRLRRHSVEYASSLARRALQDLGDAKLEEQMTRVFLRRLEELDEIGRRKLAQACRDTGMRVTLRSRFEMEAATRGLLTKAIHDAIAGGAEVLYEHGAEFACGVELSAGGQSLEWSFERYTEDLDRQIAGELERPQAAHGGEEA